MKSNGKDRTIAAAVTFITALVLLLVLWFTGLMPRHAEAVEMSTPEIMDDEMFYEPELLELGEDRPEQQGLPAPSLKGKPAKADEPNPETVDPGPAPEKTPAVNEITLRRENELKKKEAAKTEKEKREATSLVASKFQVKNGSDDGKAVDSPGSGGASTGVSGNARGRTFISCPKPDVTLRHKTVVTVNVVIDAEGNVVEATASGSADAAIRRKCENAARQAKWSPKKGASSTRGSITFTITPV